ncbi:RsmD family RNA methyltransferase [bacterium SCSIO 12741]|nr:RsmD family RNA methyltransferase [bacterium SCSIO 12741]
MRIISGKYRGKTLKTPGNLPVRPTTNFAKESLFNILNNLMDLEEIRAIDLFAGTGNISFELASRGCPEVWTVEQNMKCIRFIDRTAKELDLPMKVYRSDVFRLLNKGLPKPFDLIFADPPYDHPNLEKLPELMTDAKNLAPNGWAVLEHGPEHQFDDHPLLQNTRKYGHVRFSFFQVGKD